MDVVSGATGLFVKDGALRGDGQGDGHVDACSPGGLEVALHSVQMALNQGSDVNGAKKCSSQLMHAWHKDVVEVSRKKRTSRRGPRARAKRSSDTPSIRRSN